MKTMSPQPLALALMATCGAAACTTADNSRDAFVGTFAFASSAFETNCSPVPSGYEDVDDVVVISLGENESLDVLIDGMAMPCDDETDLQAAPSRIGCEMIGSSVSYHVDVWIDLSYERPSRMTLVKEFAAPDSCAMTFSGLLAPAP